MISDEPGDNADTIPNEDTVETVVLLLFHIPPPGLLLNADVAPTHSPVAPAIAAGDVLTVTMVDAIQPKPIV